MSLFRKSPAVSEERKYEITLVRWREWAIEKALLSGGSAEDTVARARAYIAYLQEPDSTNSEQA